MRASFEPPNDLFSALPTSGAPTMSTREIADLTGKRPDHVLRDGRKMLSDLVNEGIPRTGETPLTVGSISFEGTYRHPQNGESYPVLNLPKRECLILVSGYDVVLRTKIIDRWAKLEAAVVRPAADPLALLNDPAAMRGLLLTYSEKVLALEADRAAMTPKVEAHDRIAESFGSVCRRIAAKNLGIPPLILNRWLMTNGWTYQLVGGKDVLAYQSKMNAGYLEHKVETGDKGDGTMWTRTSVRVTPKGMLALAKAFPPAARAA